MELEDKVGYDDASVYLLDGDLVQVEHEGDIAESVRDKSFSGNAFLYLIGCWAFFRCTRVQRL